MRVARLKRPQAQRQAEGGAAPAWRAERRRRKQVPLAQLGICSRTIVSPFPAISLYRRILKRAPQNPQTLGEHLRLSRIDRGLKQTELADLLGVVYQTVVKWELNLIAISRKSRPRVVNFLGYDPAAVCCNPTADLEVD
jgi:DNA-binding XRE family transcriptional regulator